jgi:hypothetical protein
MNAPRLLRTALSGAVAVLLVSCADTPPTAPRTAALAPDGAQLLDLTLLTCSPQAYDSVTMVIGPAGGTIDVGMHQLVVFPGSLAAPTAITAVTPAGPYRRIEFAPDGLWFADPRTRLTMSYAGCDPLALLLPKKIVQVSELLDILDVISTLDLFGKQLVRARLRHFSGYAVAW